jgi:DegV family protein with EDD domain
LADKVAIITDSTACIPKDKVEEYGIELVPIGLVFGDRVYRDGVDITPAEFYEMQRQAKEPPTTGSLPEPYLEAYFKAGNRASGIVCITESSKFSGMYDSALLARRMALAQMPGVAIEVLDCSSAAAGQGLVALAAARAAAAGQDQAKVVALVEGLMPRVHLFATLDTLQYLVKGGRVPQAAALVNSVLKFKPVFSVNGGQAHTLALPRSIDSATKRILKLMIKKTKKEQPVHVAVMHADALEKAKVLRDNIASHLNCVELFITEFTPVMGVHTGPGVVGVAFYGED